jgi:putative endopeptidase
MTEHARAGGFAVSALLFVAATMPAAAAPASSALRSGIDTQYASPSIRPQDDLYRYLNGKWLDQFQIPADKGRYVSFTAVDDRTQDQLHSIVDELSHRSEATGDEDARKLADLYASFMDESRLESLGAEPLEHTFAAIDGLSSKEQIAALISRFNRTGIGAPFDLNVDPDPKDSARYAVRIVQSGLGLPDRDYYLKDDPKLKAIRDKYLVHVETMLRMAGDQDAHQDLQQGGARGPAPADAGL